MRYFKRYLGAIAIFVLLIIGALTGPVGAQNTQNFSFASFDADYYLSRDSEKAATLTVKETLVASFPSFDQNHGILRAIPQKYQDHTLSLKDISVTDESGQPYKFSTSAQNDNKVLKIGDPDTYVHGQKVYKINYKMQDVARFYKDHDEFFWDINGDQWPQAFGLVTARIHVAKELENSLQKRQICYEGTYGNTAQNCKIEIQQNSKETIITVSASNVGANQTLSVVLGFEAGTFNKKSSAIAKEERDRKLKLIAGASLAGIPPIITGLFMFRRWRQFGNDPKGRGVIIPEYEPPKGFDVLSSDYLLEQKLRNKAVSAMLIEQAVNRRLTIYEIPKKGLFGKKDYELEMGIIPAEITRETKDVLAALFGNSLTPGTKVLLSSFKKDISKQTVMLKTMKSLESQLASKLYGGGFFRKNPRSVKNGYRTWGSILVITGLVLIFPLPILWGLAAGLFLSGLITLLYSFVMSARSEAGVAANDALLGLKDYIKLAEADRLKFLQSPEGAEKIQDKEGFDPKNPSEKVKLFEKLLPYAMLFGLEKQWATQFVDIYTTPPDWYQGDWSSFNTAYLASSLGDFNSVGSTSFSSPSSSSSSGFSGGGSGGGGGGGGGGGW